jgi:hypothetical protein
VKRDEGEGRRVCTAVGKSEEGRRKSDLKEGHVRAKNECDRTYVSVCDRIHAVCVCVKWALHSNVQGAFERMHAEVCVCDGALRSNKCKLVRTQLRVYV